MWSKDHPQCGQGCLLGPDVVEKSHLSSSTSTKSWGLTGYLNTICSLLSRNYVYLQTWACTDALSRTESALLSFYIWFLLWFGHWTHVISQAMFIIRSKTVHIPTPLSPLYYRCAHLLYKCTFRNIVSWFLECVKKQNNSAVWPENDLRWGACVYILYTHLDCVICKLPLKEVQNI